MFGHIQANLNDLSEAEKNRYQSAYCGLCHTIKGRHGQLARLGLSYDLTFLALLLSSLYEPEEQCSSCRCLIHPCKQRSWLTSEVFAYAADLTVALTYHKCLDDWKDDRNILMLLYAKMLEKRYQTIKISWPRQCAAIEKELQLLAQIEQEQTAEPDAAANSFGRLMEDLFVLRHDEWEGALRSVGYGMGRYIYFADAIVDYEKDRKHGSYNPLNYIDSSPEEMRASLEGILGGVSGTFEFLPLVQDTSLLRNILYSGIWLKLNGAIEKRRRKKHD